MEPFEKNLVRTEAVGSLGESSLISIIEKGLSGVVPAYPEGIGDDCAVFSPPTGMHQLMTTDSLTYGCHFDNQVSAQDAGSKLVKRNVSDVAAMGGTPGPALLNIMMGQNLSLKWLRAFIDGVRESCKKYGVEIVGGDISQLEEGQFTASLSLCGFVAGRPKLRSGASIGDSIYVTGTLGGSILRKHFAFEPRIKEGQWLAAKDACCAMMDLTDGLGKDLAAILPASSSASIFPSKLPISEDAFKLSGGDLGVAKRHAFSDGEDYELLFALKAETNRAAFESEWLQEFPSTKLIQIGTITNRQPQGLYVDAETNQSLPWTRGFEHLKDK